MENEEYNATSLVEKTVDNKEKSIDNDENVKTEKIKKIHEDNSSLESSLESDSDNSEKFEKLLKNAKVVNISSFNKNEEYIKKFGDDINRLRKAEYENIFTQNELLRNDFLNHEKLTKEVQNSLEDAK
ncbi:hypothetical protein PCYB_103090 [Plasmodium cynomolgi strain B]|uniref:Uncharacterized protein n=1 Tax=Plasmodium cynomolgi (strain B) TaxID=1120755 RepID=K6UU95_PLACD|nr:hypothetical protein PCYB_103090 [Plasmodium cynomolgi strain B]GAB66959.1 hypothetical protein PCYB_103090 [Plasmodium cynomolgi strain B]